MSDLEMLFLILICESSNTLIQSAENLMKPLIIFKINKCAYLLLYLQK